MIKLTEKVEALAGALELKDLTPTKKVDVAKSVSPTLSREKAMHYLKFSNQCSYCYR
jgi:hypothetical protein